MFDSQQLRGAAGADRSIIDPDTTLNDLVARRPELMPTLQAFGLDLCCGGGLTLREATAHHRIPLAAVIDALGEVPPAAAASSCDCACGRRPGVEVSLHAAK